MTEHDVDPRRQQLVGLLYGELSPEEETAIRARLEAENRDLRQQRRVAEVREELAQQLPHVLRPIGDGPKKGTAFS